MNQSAVLIFCCLIILTLSRTQGMPLSRSTRCMCITRSDKPVHPRSLEKLEVIPRSPSCPHVEIIVTMKNGKKQKCLNPESKNTENLLKALSKQRSKRSTQIQRKV